MWTKQDQTEVPGSSPSGSGFPSATSSAAATHRLGSPTARNSSCLGSTLVVKGEISGEEDLQIDGKVEGPISLAGQRLTVGRTGKLNSQITARELVVYGEVSGNLCIQDRVEIKKDSQVTGDITTVRISIEDGAYFKGHIEIERAKPPADWV
jgi:cytoskeletal protein CcmA (bactofilin family)